MKKVLLCVDRPYWCFNNIAQQVKKYLGGEFDITMQTIDEAWGDYDIIVGFWYGFMPFLSARLRGGVGVTCVYDEYSWKQPGGAQQLDAALKYTDLIGAANESIQAAMSEKASVPIHLIEDGVDTDLFRPMPLPEVFTVGWCGNSKAAGEVIGQPTDDLKGLETIKEACRMASVPLKILDVGVGDPIPHEKMPEFYRNISVYCCASRAEGTPNPPLEALACGRPVISTRVGIMPKLEGESIAVRMEDRTVEAFARSIVEMRNLITDGLSVLSRSIALEWSWKNKVEGWRKLLEEAAEL